MERWPIFLNHLESTSLHKTVQVKIDSPGRPKPSPGQHFNTEPVQNIPEPPSSPSQCHERSIFSGV
ncbi:hypothetical protein AGABI1DRAFT_116598 [Agaricus bisporus var. burnettii JB137-S8]|uniref:Uncharacterized protein n=1 Tax=Agaricus bisporus var. burnettii (strain JB137-S8 / ATCC MYA-4627 / FGSC 10392) TaxID=597362 RepID=K5XKI7_AGABU|nr:uncharacterized protein AGABI1DRAFT_116598 [Agaricus bisporus var. burnettii JB137-S8]EKM75025.1 hypothetical protein AGABI1DRAFT_116598 [Agaricus bisporus var. burnettii JB137-S8]